MKRDIDLVRLILLEVEKADGYLEPVEVKLPDYSTEQINYHIMLLDEAGYLVAFSEEADNLVKYYPTHLTWEGHEFVDLARDHPAWKKLKNVI